LANIAVAFFRVNIIDMKKKVSRGVYLCVRERGRKEESK
jgi:hypothetical protein